MRRIRAAYERGARLCTICSGVFVLAAAGVLDGRTVTTHWRYAERLSKRYPTVTVEPNSSISIRDRCSPRPAPLLGLDMLLHLVRRD